MKNAFIIFILFLQTVFVSAQTITGKIVDQLGQGLPGLQAKLYITPKNYTTTTAADGSFTFTNVTNVEEGSLPTGYAISNTFPNPFNPKTRIGVTLPTRGKVRIDIYNLLGQKTTDEIEQYASAGDSYFDLELNGLPNGFYIARITLDDRYAVSRKLTLVYGSQHLSSGYTVPSYRLDQTALSHVSTLYATIDSLVVSGSSIATTVFKGLPNITGSSLNLGNLVVVQGMVAVAGGTFTAGSTLVTISSFSIDKYEITYELWTDVRNWGLIHGYTDLPIGRNGYNPVGTNNPVTEVNWYDIVKWCNARSEKDGLTPVYYTNSTQTTVYRTGETAINSDAAKWSANGYRLPTEAEWEFAARGGTQNHSYTYSGSNTVGDVAWYSANSGTTAHPVGQKTANELGIFDMSGNVWEWCWDWYGSEYPSGGTADPKGPSTTQSYRLLLGGSFVDLEYYCRVGYRLRFNPLDRSGSDGFRCVQK
jgi:formylglycine-generating enzyme